MNRWAIAGLITLPLLAGAAVLYFRKVMSTFSWPAKGRISTPFSQVDDLHPSGHNGIDIVVPIGTPVKAPADGVVESTTPSTAGGTQLILRHGQWLTGYAHLSELKVSKGQHVKRGEVVALSGNTGAHTTGPHLHMTMTNPAGEKVDPMQYLT